MAELEGRVWSIVSDEVGGVELGDAGEASDVPYFVKEAMHRGPVSLDRVATRSHSSVPHRPVATPAPMSVIPVRCPIELVANSLQPSERTAKWSSIRCSQLSV